MGHPRLPPFRCPAFPSPSPPPPPPSSQRPVTLVTENTTTGQSTWPSATLDAVVAVIPTVPPTAATSVRPTTSRPTGIPWRCRLPDAPPTRRVRKVLAGPPEDTRAHFLTLVSIKNSETVSEPAGVQQHPEVDCTFYYAPYLRFFLTAHLHVIVMCFIYFLCFNVLLMSICLKGQLYICVFCTLLKGKKST